MKFIAAILSAAVACAPRDDPGTPRPLPADSARVSVAPAAETSPALQSPDSGVKIFVPPFTAMPINGTVDTLYDQPFDAQHKLLVTHVVEQKSQVGTLRLQLVDTGTGAAVVEIASLAEKDHLTYGVVRADTTAIVISREGVYSPEMSMKLFLDPVSKKPIREVDFDAHSGITRIAETEVASVLAVPVGLVVALKQRYARPAPGQPETALLPRPLKDHPMPQPTFAEFAKARPQRVEDGYDSSVIFEEIPGPTQTVGNRIWFGKTFYDGEGTSGVGGAGYFDTSTSKYTFLDIPGMAAWSVSAILVEPQALWMGLVVHPEGADAGGGLLRHDLVTRVTTKYEGSEVVLSIVRWNNRLYAATDRGLLVIDSDLTSDIYVVEPDVDGKFELVHLRGARGVRLP